MSMRNALDLCGGGGAPIVDKMLGTAYRNVAAVAQNLDQIVYLAENLASLQPNNVELQEAGGYVQWRYVGETDWKNLFAISVLDGKTPEFQVVDNNLQWRYVGDTDWATLWAIPDILTLITETPTASKVPQSGVDGKLDTGWIDLAAVNSAPNAAIGDLNSRINAALAGLNESVYDSIAAATEALNAALVASFSGVGGAGMVGLADGTNLGTLIKTGLSRVVNSIASLKTLSPTFFQNVFVTGYYGVNDGGGGHYYYNATRAQGLANNGSIVTAAGGVGCWELVGWPDWSVEQFGAKGDGVTNDLPAINTAISALPAGGGKVRMMGKRYGIGGGVIIGNGDNAGTPSTKNGIQLIGMGGGGSFFSATPTTLVVLDGGQSTPYINSAVSVLGPIGSVRLEGFQIYCHGVNGPLANTALTMNSFGHCTVKDVVGSFYKTIGLNIQGGAAPTGNYNTHNVFNECAFTSNVDGNIGLLMDGVYAVSNDTWITSFNDCRFDTSSASNAYAGMLKFVDSISFNRCHFVGDNVSGVGKPGCYGLYFNAVGNNGFPSGILFTACSVLSTFVNETASDKIRKNTFMLYGTYDNEAIPTHPSLIGFTDLGHPFNGWGT